MKLFKLMSRLSTSPPRNLTTCYIGEGSSSSEPKKEVRFVSAKNEEKLKEMKPEIETPAVVKRTIGARTKEIGKSLSKSQRGPQEIHFCHHCGMRGHTRPNCFKLHALKRDESMHGQESSKRRRREAQARGDSEEHITMPCYLHSEV